MKYTFILTLIFFFLFSIINVNAITLNSNFNFTTEDEAHNGLFFISQYGNNSCYTNYNGNYPLWLENKTGSGNITAYGVAYMNYSNCAPYPYQTLYFYPLDNSKSTIHHVSAGQVNAEFKIFLLTNGNYIFNILKPVNLKIRNANNGFIYNQTNLISADISNALSNWLIINVSYNFTSQTDIQIILTFDDFYNYNGINYFITFYFDYFKVTGTSCVPSVYCINDFDYKIISSSCIETQATCSPDICHNFLNYSLGNITTIKGIGCYNNVSQQTSKCLDENNNAIACSKLDSSVSNYGDTTALFIGSILGIRDLPTAKAFASILITILIGVGVAFLTKKNKDLGIIVIVVMFFIITAFTLIGWFYWWLYALISLIAGFLYAKMSGLLGG